MTKNDLIDQMALNAGISRSAANKALEALVSGISETLMDGKRMGLVEAMEFINDRFKQTMTHHFVELGKIAKKHNLVLAFLKETLNHLYLKVFPLFEATIQLAI